MNVYKAVYGAAFKSLRNLPSIFKEDLLFMVEVLAEKKMRSDLTNAHLSCMTISSSPPRMLFPDQVQFVQDTFSAVS
jgi:hypothetical protein